MSITNQKAWDKWVESNKDPYGKACIDVAKEVMRMLDEGVEIEKYKLINDADENIKAGGITGFMAGCVAQMVGTCHSRGDEFLAIWNGETQIQNEGDKATEAGVALNPALLTIDLGEK